MPRNLRTPQAEVLNAAPIMLPFSRTYTICCLMCIPDRFAKSQSFGFMNFVAVHPNTFKSISGVRHMRDDVQTGCSDLPQNSHNCSSVST